MKIAMQYRIYVQDWYHFYQNLSKGIILLAFRFIQSIWLALQCSFVIFSVNLFFQLSIYAEFTSLIGLY